MHPLTRTYVHTRSQIPYTTQITHPKTDRKTLPEEAYKTKQAAQRGSIRNNKENKKSTLPTLSKSPVRGSVAHGARGPVLPKGAGRVGPKGVKLKVNRGQSRQSNWLRSKVVKGVLGTIKELCGIRVWKGVIYLFWYLFFYY